MTSEAALSDLAGLGLEATRVAGAVVAAPLAWTEAPVKAKAGLVIVLALVAHAPVQGPVDSLSHLAMSVPIELLVGVAMGLVVRIALASAHIAGDLMSPLVGIGLANLFDPRAGVAETPLTRLVRLLSTLIALELGLHRVVIGSLVASFRVLPAGSMLQPASATETLAALSSATIATGLRLAMPIVAVALTTQIGLAFISRTAPSMQIFSVGLAVTLVVGGATLVLALPDIGGALAADLSHVPERIDRIVQVLAGG